MAKLVFQSGPYAGKSVGLPAGKTLNVGRNRDVELPLPDLKLSRRHCQLYYTGDKCMLRDLDSTNGTFVNGTRIKGEVELNDFDRIVIGDTEIEFHYLEKVPLPFNFDAAAADPFGLNDDSSPAIGDDVPLEEIGGPPEAEAAPAAPAPAAPEPLAVLEPLDAPPEEPPQAAAPEPMPVEEPAEVAAAEAPDAAPIAPIHVKGNEPAAGMAPVPLDEIDPLEAALRELDKPLPPEPPALGLEGQPNERPKLVFCTSCEGSIPFLDYDLGVARVVNGHLLCKECALKESRPASGPLAVPTHASTQTVAKKAGVSDILRALDEEPVVIDTDTKPRRRTVEAQTVKPPQPAAKDVKKDMGEDFEEIS